MDEASRANRSKHRQGDGTEDEVKDSNRKKEEKRKREGRSGSKQKTTQPAANVATKYHHREVPPRFQQQKQTKHQKYSKSANKKQSKETTPWHQPLQSEPQPSWSEDDGGWSKGTPGGGSGWGGSRPGPPSSEQHTTRGGSKDWGGGVSEGAANGRWGSSKQAAELGGWSSTTPEQRPTLDPSDTWISDNENSQNNRETGSDGWQVGSKWSVSDAEVFDKEVGATDGCSQDGVGREELVSQGRSTGSDLDDLDSFSLSSGDKDTQVAGDPNGGTVANGMDGGNSQGTGTGLGTRAEGTSVRAHSQHSADAPVPQPTTPNGRQHKTDLQEGMRTGRPELSNGRSDLSNGRSDPSNMRSDLSNGRADHSNGRADLSNGRADLNNGSSNSVGSNSGAYSNATTTANSWKGDGRGKGPKAGGGGRGPGRQDGPHGSQASSGGRQDGPHGSQASSGGRLDGPHGSQASSGGRLDGPHGSQGSSTKARKKQKPSVDLGDALGALQSEPSGWGELPSPKGNENDTGTECWGVPPDLKERLERGGGQQQKTPFDGPAGGWGDQAASKDWSEKDVGSNWNGKDGTAAPQWTNGWTNQSKDRAEPSTFIEAVQSLVDMGFPHQASEKALRMNNNNLEATIGDLLALQALQEDESSGGLQQQQPFIIPSALSAKNRKTIVSRPQTTPTPAMLTMTTASTAPAMAPAAAPLPTSTAPAPAPVQYQQQLHTFQSLLAPLIPQQSLQNPLLQPPITPQQQAMQNQVLQTLLQQQRLLGLSPLLPPPNVQQVLTQQLAQAQMTRQQLTAQLKAPAQQSTGAQQQLQLQLARCNQYINLINQQLVMFSVQQKEKAQQEGKGGGGGASPQIGRSNSLPARAKADVKVGMSNGTLPPRLPFTTAAGGSDAFKTLPSAMQGLTLGTAAPTVNPPTSRSVSRLQQLIPGPSSGGESPHPAAIKEELGSIAAAVSVSVPPPQTVIAPPQTVIAPPQTVIAPPQTVIAPPQTVIAPPQTTRGQMFLPLSSPSQPLTSSFVPASVGSENAPTSSSSGDHSGATHTASVAAAPPTPAAPPTNAPPPALLADIPEFRPGVLWQPRAQPTEPAQLYALKSGGSLPSSPLTQPDNSEPKASAFPDTVQSSISGSSGAPRLDRYAVGAPLTSAAMFNPPTQQYLPPHPAVQPIGSQVAMAKSAKARVYPNATAQQQIPQQQQQQYLGRPGVGMAMGSSAMVGGGGGGGSRLNVRRSLSTSGLVSSGPTLFNPSLQSVPSSQTQAYSNAKKRGSLPQNTLIVSQSQLSAPPQHSHPGLSEARRWGGGHDGSAVGRNWEPETVGKSRWSSQEPGWRKTFNSLAAYDDSLQQSNTPPLEQYSVTSTTSLGSLAVGGRTWCQDGLGTSFNGPLSPEPTYAEWQAGKRARFPLFNKNGGTAPSLWLVVKNITPQVDEMSLREVCSEYGVVQNCIMSPSMDLAFVKYSTQIDSMKAKMGLESSPTICDVAVSIDFISESDVASLLDSFSQLRQDADRYLNGMDEGRALPTWFNDGFDDECIGEQLDDGSQAKWNMPTSGYPPKCGPRSSMWNDGNFLSGLSTPWQQQSGHLPRQDHEDASALLGGSPSNYLPNGLL